MSWQQQVAEVITGLVVCGLLFLCMAVACIWGT